MSVSCAPQDSNEAPVPAPAETPAAAEAVAPEQSEPESEPATVDTSGKVLRHAVFFKFKEESSEEDVTKVAEALAALPAEIDSIVNLQWGTNNSPESHDHGFTHCFLLTFNDEAGIKKYLPHPAHKAFGKTLGPHRNEVFVIDYWATPSEVQLEKELKHAVFFKFKDDADPAGVKAVEEAFAALPSKIDAIKAFEWGTNVSGENKDEGYTHCFMLTFDSEEGRAEYLPHPDHKAFGKVLGPVLDKVRVLDFWGKE